MQAQAVIGHCEVSRRGAKVHLVDTRVKPVFVEDCPVLPAGTPVAFRQLMERKDKDWAVALDLVVWPDQGLIQGLFAKSSATELVQKLLATVPNHGPWAQLYRQQSNADKRTVAALDALDWCTWSQARHQFALACKARGIDLDIAQQLLRSVDWNDGLDGAQLVALWLQRALSPYLLIPVDHQVRFSYDADERLRYEVHLALNKIEGIVSGTRSPGGRAFPRVDAVVQRAGCGDTFGFLAELGVSDKDLPLLLHDDQYEPLPQLKRPPFWQPDPTLVLTDGKLQHRAMRQAEEILAAAWSLARQQPLGDFVRPEASWSAEQAQLPALVRRYRVSALDGGPGCGKTWACAKLCAQWLADPTAGPVLVLAPYHQALNNFRGQTRGLALEFQTVAKFQLRDQPRAGGLIVMEEAGCVTMMGLAAVFALLASDCTVLLVGDAAQLKPIGSPGQPFADFLALLPHRSLRLTHSRRTDSLTLRQNLHHINTQCPSLLEDGQFLWIKDVQALTHDGAWQALLDRVGFDCERDVIITHTNKLRNQLNALLHARHVGSRCAATKRMRTASTRVVCCEPSGCSCDIQCDCPTVTIGQSGTVIGADERSLEVQLSDGNVVRCVNQTWDFGYAITAHKAQGSEYGCVLVCLLSAYHVQRDWLYTAVSRAKQRVIYVMSEAVHAAVLSAALPSRSSLIYMHAEASRKRTREEPAREI